MTQDPPQIPQLLTLDRVAAALSLHRRTVERMVGSGELPSVRVSKGGRRVRLVDLEAYIERRRTHLEGRS